MSKRRSTARAVVVGGELPSSGAATFFTHGSLVFTCQGLAPPETPPPFQEWAEAGAMLATTTRGAAFVVGDWIRYGESHYGEMAAQAIDARSWSPNTVRVYRRLAELVPPAVRRMDRLGVRHHLVVQSMPVDQQRYWLNRAAADADEKPWSVQELIDAIRSEHGREESGWFVVARCNDRAAMEELLKELEGRGHSCRTIVKYK